MLHTAQVAVGTGFPDLLMIIWCQYRELFILEVSPTIVAFYTIHSTQWR